MTTAANTNNAPLAPATLTAETLGPIDPKQTFGIEIETYLPRPVAAQAIQGVVGGTITNVGGAYGTWAVKAPDGRVWKVMSDASLGGNSANQAEVVSPILTYKDMDTLQEVVRAVRAAGAQVSEKCGIHIHIGTQDMGVKAITNLVANWRKNEDLIYHALHVSPQRRNTYCKPLSADFIARLESQRPATKEALNKAWYGYQNNSPFHYDSTRYCALNLHNIWFRGTIEFRLFEATLHAGKIKAYCQFALALAAKANRVKKASNKRKPFSPATAKYDFRVLMIDLGMIGDEFKSARKHLTEGLQGNASWKNGQPAAQTPAQA